ncbi:putative urea ABC transporter substrate-binding protein [Poseidonibacter antarcticus]|uniref:putative urea ABC transporter substrate-binding protein n=1 Tax=Poseidonibacter antarcticus TaxID=2478538 RepID=UPI000EF4AC86|nr:putative urea ABC transporter substrate-binding protein [Poseidonibacter antarcticus]
MKSTTFKKLIKALSLSVLVLGLTTSSLQAETKKDFKIAWTIYVGNMPLPYAAQKGIVNKWAKKYGINIEVVQVNDYIEQINQYTAGTFDAALMTNMDVLTIPAAGGVDSTILITQDFSNGNDGIVLKDKNKLEDIKGQTVNLVELSVSHYLLARGLDTVGLSERDISIINTSDADIIAAYSSDDVTSLVTWNPQLSEIKKSNGANIVFNSSNIPGEIIDNIVIHTKILNDNPELGKALVGAWFEVMEIVKNKDKEALSFMAKDSGTNIKSFQEQLDSTMMFYNVKDALKFVESQEIINTMKKVSQFSFEHGILGEGAPDAEFIGISFPNGKIYGDKNNIKLRFDNTYIKMAAEGKL